MNSNLISYGKKILGFIKRNKSEFLLAGGIAGLIGSGVWACYEVKKDTVKKYTTTEEENTEPVDEKEQKKERLKELAVSYAGPVLLGAASTGSIIASHVIIKKQLKGFVAAYAAVSSAYALYRKRVIDKYGKEQDEEFLYGINEKNMSKKVSSKKMTTDTIISANPYKYFYNQKTAEKTWYPNLNINSATIRASQEKWNRILASRHRDSGIGFVCLNEVLYELGLEPSPMGMVVGWLYDSKEGDGCINFNAKIVCDIDEWNEWSFDFNVEGNIYDKIKGVREIAEVPA